MAILRRLLPVALLTAFLAAAAPASAAIVEIGKMAEDPTPSCPGDPCLVVSRTTGYQAKVGPDRGLFLAPANGRLVAWSISLAKPNAQQQAFFEKNLGGPASAGITVLEPRKRLFGRVLASSPVQPVTDFFGQTVQFPLETSLPVAKGDLIALTVPTWVPALAVGLPTTTSWRASRALDKCQNTSSQTAQTRRGSLTQYRCLYKTARLAYTATLITAPKPNPKPKKKRAASRTS